MELESYYIIISTAYCHLCEDESKQLRQYYDKKELKNFKGISRRHFYLYICTFSILPSDHVTSPNAHSQPKTYGEAAKCTFCGHQERTEKRLLDHHFCHQFKTFDNPVNYTYFDEHSDVALALKNYSCLDVFRIASHFKIAVGGWSLLY